MANLINLDELDGILPLNKKRHLPNCPGIYFIISKDNICYVGQSKNINHRFIAHHRESDFDNLDNPKVCWIETADNLAQKEQEYIDKFNPYLNKTSRNIPIPDALKTLGTIWDPVETLPILSELSGIREDTLLKAAQQGRLMARKSGATWLSTLTAIEWSKSEGKIR